MTQRTTGAAQRGLLIMSSSVTSPLDKDVIRRGRHELTLLALLAALSLAVAACGQTRTAIAGKPTATAQPQASFAATPTVPSMPYTFSNTWRRPAGAALHINNFVFVASAPATGYACATGYPLSGSGPSLLVTKDDGATWATTGAYPLGAIACQVFSDPADAADVFVVQPSNYAGFTQGQAIYTPDVWRSRDGGGTWTKLATITIKQTRAGISNLAILGSRLVASVVPATGDGAVFWDGLVASDDGGATWQQIGQGLKTAGQVSTFVTAGSTLFIEVQPGCVGCSYADMAEHLVPRLVPSDSRLVAPASSLIANSYYRSADAGATWVKIGLPANSDVSALSFAASQSHPGQYVGVAIVQSLDATSYGQRSLYYTLDTGVTWRPVGSFQGVGGGWPDPATHGQNGQLTVLPDQAIFAGTVHDMPGAQPPYPDAGIFRLGLESSGEWRPVAPNSVHGADGSTGFVGQWQVVPSGSGWRIWGIAYGTATSSGLTYLDVS